MPTLSTLSCAHFIITVGFNGASLAWNTFIIKLNRPFWENVFHFRFLQFILKTNETFLGGQNAMAHHRNSKSTVSNLYETYVPHLDTLMLNRWSKYSFDLFCMALGIRHSIVRYTLVDCIVWCIYVCGMFENKHLTHFMIVSNV